MGKEALIATNEFYTFLRDIAVNYNWRAIDFTYREKKKGWESWIEVDVFINVDEYQLYIENAQDFKCSGDILIFDSDYVLEVDADKFMYHFESIKDIIMTAIYDELSDIKGIEDTERSLWYSLHN